MLWILLVEHICRPVYHLNIDNRNATFHICRFYISLLFHYLTLPSTSCNEDILWSIFQGWIKWSRPFWPHFFCVNPGTLSSSFLDANHIGTVSRISFHIFYICAWLRFTLHTQKGNCMKLKDTMKFQMIYLILFLKSTRQMWQFEVQLIAVLSHLQKVKFCNY